MSASSPRGGAANGARPRRFALCRWLFRQRHRGKLPPEFDWTVYRRAYPELSALSPRALRRHYVERGRAEGRVASQGAFRQGFLTLLPDRARVLEIGPSVRPLVRGPNVAYFDVADRDALVARALADGFPADDGPEIDYVSPTGDLGVVPGPFDALVSSHCIEHQPDLVAHLLHAARLLRPGGRYFLLVPDKRFCFDHFLPESTLEAVRAAHAEARRLHTPRSVYEHRVLTTHNDPIAHWRGEHGAIGAAEREARAVAAAPEIARARHDYVDVHAWQFTPKSFRAIVRGLKASQVCPLAAERVYDTPAHRIEFTAVLRKPG